MKLTAAAFDRLSTVVLGGAVLAPIFQHNEVSWDETATWAAAAFLLHGMGHVLLRLLKEEA